MNADVVHGLELSWIRFLQLTRTPSLDNVMTFLNLLDTFPFYIFFVSCIWWLYRQKCGFHLLCLLVLSIVVNSDLKAIFSQPRPFWLDPQLGLVTVPDFGFPSGGAQTMTALFGYLALTVKKRWFWVVSIGFVLLISFSRVYLGIHFPSDIIGGWVVGALLVAGFYLGLPYIENIVDRQPAVTLLYLSVITTIILSFLCINPNILPMVFFGFGGGVGYIVAKGQEAEGFFKRMVTLLIALGGLAVLHIGIAHLPQKFESVEIELISFFLQGWWIAFVPSLAVR
jgi:membrane-associated phospholipid phosphatase